ncbi:hypothetical protein PRIPAC_97265 [Pristionchus pacificus]|uniref:G protein-coupled receptor n=1 Tax=Pristionchus pacificus TaxID=54126 RepID=A0A2A6B3E9_PRIPA|nr:hypothetical protein PRIPAC_97265 [Pristionchus pacificus]|eukprot:PDM60406.1 G protein-coupled receptor [Pristionchus pacificus]
MSQVPLPFCIIVLVISIFGLAGNIQFLVAISRRRVCILLVLMTALHIVLCIVQMSDIVREFLGVSLTRSSCLRFVGAYYASFSFAQSILYSLLGLEVLVLISDANLYRKLRVWWFHAVVYSTFIFSGWCIYISWISEEDRPVLLCIPPTALTKDINMIRSSWVMLNSCFVVALYVIILAILMFMTGFLVSFSSLISQTLNIPISYVVMTASLPAIVTYSQTHYVYFFVSTENRKAFRRRGPKALFLPTASLALIPITNVAKSVSSIASVAKLPQTKKGSAQSVL